MLSSLGYCSRREVRDWVKQGCVTVDGVVAKAHDQRADPAAVRVNGEALEAVNGLLAVFYKPVGYVCTHSGDEGPTIYELLPPRWLSRNPAVSSVGRLDKDTSGLLLITDQGQLIQRYTSPRSEVEKRYEVTVDGEMTEALQPVFASGELMLRGEDKPCLPAQLKITGPSTGVLTITEGRYHQVRRMFASQGLHVTALHRSHFGRYDLGQLQPGEWRMESLEG